MPDPNNISELKFDSKNARKRSQRSNSMLIRSLEEVGAARSIVIDENNVILAGNGTIEAAGQVGIEKVTVVEVDGNEIVAVRRKGLSTEQKQKLALYDNRTSDLSEWDIEMLAEISQKIDISDCFTEDELQQLLNESSAEVEDDNSVGAMPAAVREATIASQFKLIVTCQNENERSQAMELLQEKGYQCRVID